MTQKFKDDFLGKQFGKLTILGENEDRDRPKKVSVYCECGNKKEVMLTNLIYGNTKSCGCERSKKMSQITRKKAKHLIETPKGPLSLAQLARDTGVSYYLILSRFKTGERDINKLTAAGRLGYKKEVPDNRLGGMSNKQAAEFFQVTKQVVSNRLKYGWWVNKHKQWIRANGQPLKKKYYGKRRKQRRAKP